LFRADQGFAQICRVNVEREITPVQAERRDAGVLHRRRGRVFDGMPNTAQ